MKKIKKVLAVLLTLAMVMAMSLTAFAANGTPEASDTTTVTITGITGSPSITLYQISSGVYGDGEKEFIRYNYVDDVSFANPLQPTSAEITNIANELVAGRITANTITTGALNEETGVYTATVNAGMFIAVITGAEDGSVYNPVLLSASYTSESNLSGGTVNSNAYYLWGSTAVAKKTTPDIEKEVTGGTTADGEKMTASIGDVISYKITPTMPSYPAEAVNKTFFVSDTMTAGLTFQYDSLAVSIDGQTVTKNENNFLLGEEVIAVAHNTENGFNLCFDYEKLIYGNGTVYVPIITYTAVINAKAVVGGVGNTNTATLYYSNTPNNGSDWEDPTNKPDNATGVVTENSSKTIYTYQLSFKKIGQDVDAEALANAIFGIYKDKECTTLVDTVITNENGYAVSTNVAKGTYYIKEIEAPDGYTLNTTVYDVEASWDKATITDTAVVTDRTYTTEKPSDLALQVGWIKDGRFYALDEYTTPEIAAAAGAQAAYVASESTTTTTSETITTNGAGSGTVGLGIDIPNTKLSALPSTGGMGTTLFTIGGCIIMILAAALFFVNRRRSAE